MPTRATPTCPVLRWNPRKLNSVFEYALQTMATIPPARATSANSPKTKTKTHGSIELRGCDRRVPFGVKVSQTVRSLIV